MTDCICNIILLCNFFCEGILYIDIIDTSIISMVYTCRTVDKRGGTNQRLCLGLCFVGSADVEV